MRARRGPAGANIARAATAANLIAERLARGIGNRGFGEGAATGNRALVERKTQRRQGAKAQRI
jgi:hypothetical protein